MVIENSKIGWLDYGASSEREVLAQINLDNNGYVNTWDGSAIDYGDDANPVDITEAELATDYVPVSGDNLYQAGKVVTPTIEVDRNWAARDTANPSIGSIAPT